VEQVEKEKNRSFIKKIMLIGVIAITLLTSACGEVNQPEPPITSDYPPIIEVYSENGEILELDDKTIENLELDYSLEGRRFNPDASDNPQTIYLFQDENLENAIIEHLISEGLMQEGETLTIGHLMQIKDIDLSNKGITNLTGIEHLTSLETISLANNPQLTVVDGLFSTRNINLKSANLENTAIRNLSDSFVRFLNYSNFESANFKGTKLPEYYATSIINLMVDSGKDIDIRDTGIKFSTRELKSLLNNVSYMEENLKVKIDFEQIDWTDEDVMEYLFDESGNQIATYFEISGIEFIEITNPEFANDLLEATDYLKEVIGVEDSMSNEEKTKLIVSYFYYTYKDENLIGGTNNLVDIIKGETPSKEALDQLTVLMLDLEEIDATLTQEGKLIIDLHNGTTIMLDDVQSAVGN
jgi:uncharacterized protein YjbI with pentapeptide repeats